MSGAWLPQTNSVNGASAPNTANLPSPADRVEELIEERPRLARTPVASKGRRLREWAVEADESEPVSVTVRPRGPRPNGPCDRCGGAGECPACDGAGCESCEGGECRTCAGSGDLYEPQATIPADDAGDVRALTVAEVLYRFLCRFDERRGATIHLERRAPDGTVLDELDKEAGGSFTERYRKRRYAELMGYEREIDDALEEPVVALLGLTASGTDADGAPRPPADHMREIAETWSKSGGTRETIRNRLESGLGLEPDKWTYIKGGEPHPGDGPNAGYHHDHPAVVVDGAALEEPVATVEREMERAVEKHVAECPTAEPEAHRDAVTVKHDDDLEEGIGTYIGAYVAADGDTDLFEEPLEYLVWAATTAATGTQKFTAGRQARAMIDADWCRTEADDGLHGPHGSRLNIGTDAWGRETVECAHCGSTHDVPDTHREARRARAEIHRAGPLEEPDDDAGAAPVRASTTTVERWCPHPAGSNRCPLCAEEQGAVPPDVPIPDVAFNPAVLVGWLLDDPPPDGRAGRRSRTTEPEPEWTAVEVRMPDGEAHPIGTPGGVEFRRVTDAPADPEVAYRRRLASLEDRLADVESDGPEQVEDMRRVVIDAVRDASGPVTAEAVARETPVTEETVAEVLGQLRTHGRVVPVAGGYVPAD